MKFVIDSPPNYCPNCGTKLFNTHGCLEDFNMGASHQCKCGTHFQRVPGDKITKLAAKHGDAGNYWK